MESRITMIWVLFILGIIIAWTGVLSASENGVRKDNVGFLILGLLVAIFCVIFRTVVG
jgi:hypothetical protein